MPTSIMMGKRQPPYIIWFWRFCHWLVSLTLPLRCLEASSTTISNLTKEISSPTMSFVAGTGCMNQHECSTDGFGTETFLAMNMKAGSSFMSSRARPPSQAFQNIGDGLKVRVAKANAGANALFKDSLFEARRDVKNIFRLKMPGNHQVE